MNTIKKIILGSITLGIAGIASAETAPQRPQRQGPPPQAIEACNNKAVGTQCSFTARRGDVQGQCAQTPRGQTTCRPEGRQQGNRRGANGDNNARRQGGRDGNQQARRQNAGNGNQQGQRRPGRSHSILTSAPLKLIPSTAAPIAANKVSVTVSGAQRTITANGIAKHKTGAFPNGHNPHGIAEQKHVYSVPLNPQLAANKTDIRIGKVGIAVNGVLIEPATAEVYKEARDWRYEALSGAVPLGIDSNYAHVQPGGNYHYHGLPTDLMRSLGVHQSKHSPLIGWAADGFPIYALFGYKNAKNIGGGIQRESSSYRLKGTQRPGGNLPTGKPDGTFAQDYAYVAGAGTLDECNGKMTATPESPNGTYAYFITDTFPVIPRCLKGTPSSDFTRRVAVAGGARF
ncbi:YHYH protein [Leucothrix arctica]|uniref:YHYH domain-containing protein n=1 Tax=Leucothrix arctica TaxID=1481894 RepID=A0A317C521_9GAMM|nr:YHYH protein [Leucothrix arctica]PWQ93745.1 hypothetical protein DKT75_19235 [Leucothrix arctica]